MNIDAPRKTHLPALRNLWQEAFGDAEEFLNAFYRTAFSPSRCRCVTSEGKIIAALYWFDCLHRDRHVAYVYAVATAKAYRGQGICHKLMEDTHLHLTKLGYEGVILAPGNKALFELYEGMEYRICSHIREFSCTGLTQEIHFACINQTEYAALRRQFLPEGGVIQESENLDFLRTQVKFYTGSEFLLAARGDADTLYGMELLGDTTVAPGIVHALGYTKGTFRTPGEGVPFAMYHSLGDSKLLPPTYFGLAFD